jgi:hypothetical protein
MNSITKKKREREGNKLPAWFLKQERVTPRQWKARKRKEVKETLRALGNLRTGCVYLPCGAEPLRKIAKELQQIKKQLAVKSWGR